MLDYQRGAATWMAAPAAPVSSFVGGMSFQSADHQRRASLPLLCCWDMTRLQPMNVDPAWHHKAAAVSLP